MAASLASSNSTQSPKEGLFVKAATTIVISALLLLGLAGSATAEPTSQVAGGRTSVALSEEFLDAVGDLGLHVSPIRPGSLRRGGASFPIAGGALDLADARGDIFHTGGLTLRAGTTEVRLLNFVIDTQDSAVLTGLVVRDGDLIGRVPLFNLGLGAAAEVKRPLLVVRDVDVRLTFEAATALNGIFGVDAFVEDFPIGEATVLTFVFGSGH
jgi:hypothetical protein